jgi:phosphatidylglycerol:prolipoprotein diacylglycerol transferase
MYPPINPILLQIGPISIHWYGVLIMLGILAAMWVMGRYVARKGQDPDTIWDGILWALIPALVGARLYYVFIQSPRGPAGLDYYLANPLAILNITTGGLHIFGAFIGGAIGVLLYVRHRQLPVLIYLDAIGLGLPLGQAIGRVANFINQELYGPPTTLPWGLRIDAQHRLAPYNDMNRYPDSVRFQPLFLYECLWNLIGFSLLLVLSRRAANWLRDGDLILLYLIWYPLGRFGLEFFRTDSWFFPGTPFNLVHILSFVLVCTATVALVWRHLPSRNKQVAQTH